MSIGIALLEWSSEHGKTLPDSIYSIVHIEHCGGIVDLETGARFYQQDDWRAFATSWCAERKRRGLPVDPAALVVAMLRAGCDFDPCVVAVMANVYVGRWTLGEMAEARPVVGLERGAGK